MDRRANTSSKTRRMVYSGKYHEPWNAQAQYYAEKGENIDRNMT